MVNPLGTINSFAATLLKGILDHSVSFYGFSDGSFSSNSSIAASAGMGGYLKNKDNELLFIFSGPSVASSSLMSEILEVKHLIVSFASFKWSTEDCVFFTNGDEVLNIIVKVKLGLDGDSFLIDLELRDSIRKPNFYFKHISGRLNLGADDLVNQGRARTRIIQGWFI